MNAHELNTDRYYSDICDARKQNKKVKLSKNLRKMLKKTRPLKELDLKDLKKAIQKLNKDPIHVLHVCMGAFTENLLEILEKEKITIEALAKKSGINERILKLNLDEDFKHMPIIELVQLSLALNYKLTIELKK